MTRHQPHVHWAPRRPDGALPDPESRFLLLLGVAGLLLVGAAAFLLLLAGTPG